MGERENIILRHSDKRGMDMLKPHLEPDFCLSAARDIMKLKNGNIFLLTGFYVKGFAETDGPVGAYFLAEALRKLSFNPIIVSDRYCRGFFKKPLGLRRGGKFFPPSLTQTETIYVDVSAEIDAYELLLREYAPVCLISVERCGVNKHGKYQNMRKADISQYTAKLDTLFSLAEKRNTLTIGIGDGGNEIGMGKLKDVIEAQLPVVPCVVTAKHLIISSVSNWGAYGLISALSEVSGVGGLLPRFGAVRRYLSRIVSLGAVDGTTGVRSLSVDGFSIETEEEILSALLGLR